MRAADHLQDAEWALQLREMASDSGHGSIHLDNLVVTVLARTGRLEEARDILQVGGCALAAITVSNLCSIYRSPLKA